MTWFDLTWFDLTCSGSFKWYGGVLGPNNKIYGIPSHSTSVLIINPGEGEGEGEGASE